MQFRCILFTMIVDQTAESSLEVTNAKVKKSLCVASGFLGKGAPITGIDLI